VPVLETNSCRHEAKRHWTCAYQAASTLKTRRPLVPFTCMIVVCAVFPIGLWSNLEAESRADLSRSVKSKLFQAKIAPRHGSQTRLAAARVEDMEKTAPATAELSTPASANGENNPSIAAIGSSPVAITPAVTPSGSNAANTNNTVTAPSGVQKALQVAGRPLTVHAIVSGKKQTSLVTVAAINPTVEEALRAMGIALEPLDRVTPPVRAAAFDGMTVMVTQVRAILKKRIETLQPDVLYKPTTNLAPGEKKTSQRGKPGVVEITERIWSRDGKVTMREFVSRKVVSPTRHRIVELGSRARYMPNRIPYHNRYAQAYAFASRGSSLSARGGSPRDRFAAALVPGTLRAVRSITLVATGYSPDPSENGGYTTTATGLPIGYGAAAVDPRVVPLGTKLYVEGYGYAFACDTGGAIKGHRIDLAYNSYYVANTKGRRRVRAWILAP
jgi:3D (Asp-Asp-Asp) domain-containing protein